MAKNSRLHQQSCPKGFRRVTAVLGVESFAFAPVAGWELQVVALLLRVFKVGSVYMGKILTVSFHFLSLALSKQLNSCKIGTPKGCISMHFTDVQFLSPQDCLRYRLASCAVLILMVLSTFWRSTYYLPARTKLPITWTEPFLAGPSTAWMADRWVVGRHCPKTKATT